MASGGKHDMSGSAELRLAQYSYEVRARERLVPVCDWQGGRKCFQTCLPLECASTSTE